MFKKTRHGDGTATWVCRQCGRRSPRYRSRYLLSNWARAHRDAFH